MNTWDTLPVHDERIPPGLSLAADCSLEIGAVRSSFWQELAAGLHCWEEMPRDQLLVYAPPARRDDPPQIGIIRGLANG